MRTEYKFGLGRDRRILSRFQTPEWCRWMSELPRKMPDRRGEKQSNAKLLPADVVFIRSFPDMPRVLAKIISDKFGIAVSYVYGLRKIVNGRYKKWPHLAPAGE